LIAASLLPNFPTGSDAAVKEPQASGVQHGTTGASLGGQWDLTGHSDVSVMHAIIRPFTDNILFLERVQASTVVRAQGTSDGISQDDTYAWSTEFSTQDGSWRSLDVKSNMFCSAGGYLPDGVRRTHVVFFLLHWKMLSFEVPNCSNDGIMLIMF
jgi:hypothetical protein